MKSYPLIPGSILLIISLLGAARLQAQTTAFTYQGHLTENGAAAQSAQDLTFTLYDAASGGATVGTSNVVNDLSLSNGLFTVTLDFGAGAFDGNARWLEAAVRPGASSGAYTVVSPRQPITSVPYAVRAANASSVAAANITGTIALAQLPAALVTNGASGLNLSGGFVGNGAGITNVYLSAANSQGAIIYATSWKSTASSVVDSGNFIGFQAVTAADVNGDGVADLISVNTQTNTLTIRTNNGSGGFGMFSTLTVVDGPLIVVSADLNKDGSPDLIAANGNNANNLTVLTNNGVGGFVSIPPPAFPDFFPLSPGYIAVADLTGTNGLDLIVADRLSSWVALFHYNTNSNDWSATAIAQFTPYSEILTSIKAADLNGDGRVDLVVGSGYTNALSVWTNSVTDFGTNHLSYGSRPITASNPSAIEVADVNGDGALDIISAGFGTNILSVFTNDGHAAFALASSPIVGLGTLALAAADFNGDGTVDLMVGGHTGTSQWLNDGSGFFVPGNSLPADIDIDFLNFLTAAHANADGKVDLIAAWNRFVLGHWQYEVAAFLNDPNVRAIFVGSGAWLADLNAANLTGTIPDERLSPNVALRTGGNAFAGTQTVTNGSVGIGTTTPARTLTVQTSPFDYRIEHTDGTTRLSTYLGNGAWFGTVSLDPLYFYVNDGPSALTVSTNGNVGIGLVNPVSELHVDGTVTATAFNPPSDRQLKENFSPVNPQDVLRKVAALPISRWNFISDATTPHLGPMAQDFHAAFGLGTDERHIATVDADGVALAAIQGLNAKLEEEIKEKRARIAELEARLDKLEKFISKIHRD